MTRFVFIFLNGITLAGLYFLVASGLTLIFGLMIVEYLGNSLRALVEQGQRILLIEQNLKFAASLCDEIAILANGQIQATVSSYSLLSSSDLQSKYLGVA